MSPQDHFNLEQQAQMSAMMGFTLARPEPIVLISAGEPSGFQEDLKAEQKAFYDVNMRRLKREHPEMNRRMRKLTARRLVLRAYGTARRNISP